MLDLILKIDQTNLIENDEDGILLANYITLLMRNGQPFTHLINELYKKMELTQNEESNFQKTMISKAIFALPEF
jgi:hypothetical protein